MLAIIYVCFVLNHAYNQTLRNIHMNVATGSNYDMSPLLRFHFWQPIYFNSDDSSFTSKSTEEIVGFVGISENVGHDMIFYVLNTTTNEVFSRSNARLVGELTSLNLRIDPLTVPEVFTCRHLPSIHLEDDEESPTITKCKAPNASTS